MMKGNVMNQLYLDVLEYADEIRADYAQGKDLTNDPWLKEMVDSFQVSFDEGRKYIKIVTSSGGNTSAHSFIVKEDHGKFKAGDILMASSWKAPATNFARGNVLEGRYKARWTGVH
jgi:hypothetical protein